LRVFLGKAAQNIDEIDHGLRRVAGHHRGRSVIGKDQPASSVLHRHGRDPEEAGHHRAELVGILVRRGQATGDHEAGEQRRLREQHLSPGRLAPLLVVQHEQPRQRDHHDEDRHRQQLGDGELGRMHHLEAKHDEVAGDVRREQSKQRDEADHVDETADE